tara:strand:- start:210 stop:452 length:243 start_codon:yes stop_codon:yes gene_type:complete
MTAQSRYADEILNSSDSVKHFISDLPSVSSLWVLYYFVDDSKLSFKDWLIKTSKKKIKKLEEELPGLTMDTEINMEISND